MPRFARLLTASTLAALLSTAARAEEGMWMPSQAPALAERLKAAGLKLDPRALADMQAAPMNAIVSLGGCSASFVSPQGLVVSNHHCVYDSIQYNSAPGRNYLADGFLAARLADELPASPGSRILVMESLTDVSAAMLDGLTPAITGVARTRLLEERRKSLIAQCEADAGYRCDVRPYFGGGSWWRQKMLEIRDVRLVYAPAGGIGNFGGEVDNWQWPRHTGDFGFYRAYVGRDGKPAAFSRNNVPYRPRGVLKLASSDMKDGDFVLIAGYPGETERFKTARETIGWYGDIYPTQQRLLTENSDLILREARTDAEKIAYASLLKRSDNYKKKILGQIDIAKSSDLVGLKQREQDALAQWAARPEINRGPAIVAYDRLVEEDLAATRAQLVNSTLNRAQLLAAARTLYRWANEQQKPDADRAPGFQARDRQLIADRLKLIDRQYVPRIDRLMLEAALTETAKLPEAQRNTALEQAIRSRGLDNLYAGTRLADPAERLAWLDRPVADFQASTDPFIQVAVAGFATSMAAEEQQRDRDGRMHPASVAYMEAVAAHAASTGKLLYPDANSSLRFTFGRVGGRPTEDGRAWTAFTTPRGILAKATGVEPFNAPAKLLDALRAGDWGRWGSPALGTLPVNFLSTTDITNGNSGSAVLNAQGELVGLAFDGTIEGMLADWKVDEATNRTIAVDARYMGFVMDKVDGAKRLLTEMGVK